MRLKHVLKAQPGAVCGADGWETDNLQECEINSRSCTEDKINPFVLSAVVKNPLPAPMIPVLLVNGGNTKQNEKCPQVVHTFRAFPICFCERKPHFLEIASRELTSECKQARIKHLSKNPSLKTDQILILFNKNTGF